MPVLRQCVRRIIVLIDLSLIFNNILLFDIQFVLAEKPAKYNMIVVVCVKLKFTIEKEMKPKVFGLISPFTHSANSKVFILKVWNIMCKHER